MTFGVLEVAEEKKGPPGFADIAKWFLTVCSVAR
jgi:hypothetical protein